MTRGLVDSAARTASGSTTILTDFNDSQTARVKLNVTAASGTSPTLDVVIEDTFDDGATWNTVGTFTQRVGTGSQVISLSTPFSSNLRARWTIGGSAPSFTFSVRGYFQD
jgi:hypothetical protein